MISFKGRKVQIQELSREYGIPWSTIYNRHQSGYVDDELLVDHSPVTLFFGKKTTLASIAEAHNLSPDTIKGRYAAGLRDAELVKKCHRGKGSENAATKLNVDMVVQIKTLLLTTTLKQHEIAKIFGVDQGHISDIKRGKRWAKVVIHIESLLSELESYA